MAARTLNALVHSFAEIIQAEPQFGQFETSDARAWQAGYTALAVRFRELRDDARKSRIEWMDPVNREALRAANLQRYAGPPEREIVMLYALQRQTFIRSEYFQRSFPPARPEELAFKQASATVDEVRRFYADDWFFKMLVLDASDSSPTVCYLLRQWRAQGKSYDECFAELRDWSRRPPRGLKQIAEWTRARKRGKRLPIDPYFDQPVLWQRSKDLLRPWQAEVNGQYWQLSLNDFPEEFLCTLLVNDEPVGTFNDLPSTWERVKENRKKLYVQPWPLEPVSLPVVEGTWAERYRAGDCELVWDEIVELGEAVYAEPHRSQVEPVLAEMMRRVRQNLKTLISRLEAEKFQFTYEYVWEEPQADSLSMLEQLEQTFGPLPRVLKAWYEQIGAVCLIGRHPKLCPQSEDPFADDVKLADPFMIQRLAEAEEAFLDWKTTSQPTFDLDLSMGAEAKALIGEGGGGVSASLPARGADCNLDTDQGRISFVEHLRLVFRWGGFPGWADESRPPKQLLAKLTRDLLPI